MSYLITGGAGFIGNYLCERLLDMKKNIVVVDDFSLGLPVNIERFKENPLFTFYNVDINSDNFEPIFKNHSFETIFHLAANSNIDRSFKNPNIDIDNTLNTTITILNCMKKYGIKELIFASSSAIYGETFEQHVDEKFGPLIPQSHYGAAKMASEGFIYSYCENYGLKAWIARFPNVVGDYSTHGVVYDFIKKLKLDSKVLEILGDGKQTKSYLYISDLIDALLFIWKESNDNVNIFNIGNNSSINVKEIAEITCKAMNVSPEFKFQGGSRGWVGDVPNFTFDFEKLKNLGWNPKFSSEEAVFMTAIWLRDNIH